MARDHAARDVPCSGQESETGRAAKLMSIPHPKFVDFLQETAELPRF
jgi:hypothetical protein